MGMYTEIVVGFELRADTPETVVSLLRAMIDGEAPIPDELPAHNLFTKPRWRMLGQCSSYYFGFHESCSRIVHDEHAGSYCVAMRASVKNYEGEVEAFFDWIRPYVDSGSGTRDMIGYSIYEEASEPSLYYLRED